MLFCGWICIILSLGDSISSPTKVLNDGAMPLAEGVWKEMGFGMFKSNYFKTQFFAFMLITLFSLSIMLTVVTSISMDQVRENIKESNRTAVSFIQNNIDKEITKMTSIGNSIAGNSAIIDLAGRKDVAQSRNYDGIVRAQKVIGSFTEQWGINIYAYSSVSGFVLAKSSYYEADIYIDNVLNYTNIDSQSFLKTLEATNYFSILGVFDVERGLDEAQYVVSVTPIIDFNSGRHLGAVVIEIENSLFIGENSATNEDESIYLVNSENGVMLSYGSADISLEDISKIQSASGELRDGRYYYSVPSRVNNWRYLCTFESGKAGSGATEVVLLLLIAFMAICVLAVLGAYFLARRMQRPVKNLVDKYGDLHHSEYVDEYKYIDNVMEQMKTENSSLRSRLKKNNMTLKKHLINSILNGEGIENYKGDLNRILDTQHVFEFFQVAVIGSEFSEGSTEMLNKTQIILSKRFEESGLGLNGFMLRKREDLLVVLLNMSEDYIEKEKIYDIFEEVVELSQRSMTFVTVGLGGQYAKIDDVNKSYVEAFFAYGKKNSRGFNSVISIEDLDKKEMTNRFSISDSYEKMLINSVKTAATDQMESLLGEVRHFVEETGDDLEARNICSVLIIILMRTINSMELDVGEVFGDELALRKLLSSNDSKLQIEKTIEFYNVAAEYVQKNKEGKYEQIYEAVLRIVEEEYSNEINLNEIAQRLNLSASYISWIFKKNANTNFSDYIAEFRIEKAKVLLESGKYGIAEVGKLVGISNSNSFIRTFKKYEGMTPGAYKDMNV